MRQKVVCKVCRRLFKFINSTHLATHGMTVADYRRKWPTAVLADDQLRRLRRQRALALWEDPEYKQSCLDGLERTRRDPEANRKLRRSLQQALNTPEVKERRSKTAQRLWRDPDYRERTSASLAAMWQNQEYRERRAASLRKALSLPKVRRKKSRASLRMWQNADYRSKQEHSWSTWTQPERIVRGWLCEMGYYQTKSGVGFVPHAWLPMKGSGFSANGDFVDYRNRVVLHVDGPHHYNPDHFRYARGRLSFEQVQRKDRAVDKWCTDNGWDFLRLTDVDIGRKPKRCQRLIRELVAYLL